MSKTIPAGTVRRPARLSLLMAWSSMTMLGPISGAAGEAAAAVGEHGFEETRLSLATSRCTTLGEVVSCDAALNMKPNDPDLLVA